MTRAALRNGTNGKFGVQMAQSVIRQKKWFACSLIFLLPSHTCSQIVMASTNQPPKPSLFKVLYEPEQLHSQAAPGGQPATDVDEHMQQT
jgi:hypothetical protein